MDTRDLIIKTYALEAVKTAQYGVGISYAVANGKVKNNNSEYKNIQPQDEDLPLYKSKLGTPVFTNFELQGGSWTDDNGVLHTWDFQQFDTVLTVVDKPKNIIKTVIQGRNGSVKEYIGDGDYQITIRLIVIGDRKKMPLQEIADLKRALDAPVALEVNSRYLQNLGINNIVVESYSMPQAEGAYHYQAFEIRCSSDEPIELKIK